MLLNSIAVRPESPSYGLPRLRLTTADARLSTGGRLHYPGHNGSPTVDALKFLLLQKTRSGFACIASGVSPISSRNRVPRLQRRRVRRRSAPALPSLLRRDAAASRGSNAKPLHSRREPHRRSSVLRELERSQLLPGSEQRTLARRSKICAEERVSDHSFEIHSGRLEPGARRLRRRGG